MTKPRFQASADRALAIFDRLHVPDMIGLPTMAEVCRPWARNYVAELFGGQDPKTGKQTIRESLVLIPKKSGKTTLIAAVLLVAALLNERRDAEILLLSSTRDVATIAFKTICGMIAADPELAEQFHIRRTQKIIDHTDTGLTIRVVALASSSVAGSRASWVLVDEVWALGQLAGAQDALVEATGGLASREEGFVCYATTQSPESPAGVWLEKLQYARRVASGEIKDDSFLPLLYELPPRYDWQHNFKKAIKRVCPNLGASVSEEYLTREFQKVKGQRNGALQGFAAKFLNVEIGMNLRSNTWPGAEFWERQQIPLTLDELLERSEVVVAGVDGGGLDDLLGFCVMGRERETKRKLSWSHAWCAPIALERHKEIAPRLRDFAAAGELSIADTGKDVAELAAIVAKVRETGKLDKVGVDRAGLGGILEALNGVGVLADEIVGIPQGWQLATHAQTAERWLAGGELQVAKQDLMVWSVGNAIMEPRSNGAIITKAASGKAKIDPVIALINAVAVLSQNPEARGPKKMVFFSL